MLKLNNHSMVEMTLPGAGVWRFWSWDDVAPCSLIYATEGVKKSMAGSK
ncbi:MAG: hypothetical protein ACTS44_00395 [Candidatus Hodgkinia cicadicola]